MKLTDEQVTTAVAVINEKRNSTCDGDERTMLTHIADKLPADDLTDTEMRLAGMIMFDAGNALTMTDADKATFLFNVALHWIMDYIALTYPVYKTLTAYYAAL